MEVWSASMEIDAIHLQRENLAVLCSNLTGNIWNGQVFVCEFDGGVSVKHTMFFSFGVSQGLWHGGKLYLGSDEGCLYVYSKELSLQSSSRTHNDSIQSLSKKGAKILASDNLELLLLNEDLTLVSNLQESGILSVQWLDDSTCLALKSTSLLKIDVNTTEKSIISVFPENCEKMCLFDGFVIISSESCIFKVTLNEYKSEEISIPGIISCLARAGDSLLIGTEIGDLIKLDLSLNKTSRVRVHKDKITSITVQKEVILTSSLDRTIKSHSIN